MKANFANPNFFYLIKTIIKIQFHPETRNLSSNSTAIQITRLINPTIHISSKIQSYLNTIEIQFYLTITKKERKRGRKKRIFLQNYLPNLLLFINVPSPIISTYSQTYSQHPGKKETRGKGIDRPATLYRWPSDDRNFQPA